MGIINHKKKTRNGSVVSLWRNDHHKIHVVLMLLRIVKRPKMLNEECTSDDVIVTRKFLTPGVFSMCKLSDAVIYNVIHWHSGCHILQHQIPKMTMNTFRY